jgi:putative flippase GtrA
MKRMIRKVHKKVDTPTTRKFVVFGIVGGIGAVLNTAILFVLTTFGMHYLAASLIATEAAIVSNFFGNHMFTFKDSKEAHLGKRFLIFQAVSMISLVCTLVVLWILTSNFGERFLLIWNLIAIITASLLNFTLNLKYTWNSTEVRS